MTFQFRLQDASAATRRPGRAWVAAATIALLSLSLSACGSSGSDAKSSASTGGSTATSGGAVNKEVAAARAHVAALTAPITKVTPFAPVSGDVKSLKGKTVWYIPFGGANPFLTGLGGSMADALSHVGVKVHVCDGKFQPPAVASCMQQAGQQGADAVVTGFIDYRLLSSAFDALAAKGIPVLLAGVAADAGPSASPKLQFYDTASTIAAQQRVLADTVIADSDGKAKILVVGVTDSPQTAAAGPYLKKYFGTACPNCKVNSVDFSSAAVSKLPSLINSALISHPDTNYVVETFDTNAGAIASAIQSAGKANKIKFGANGGGLDSFQRVASGGEFALVAGGPTYSAWQYADAVVRMMTGGKPVITAAPIRVITKANVGSLKLTPDNYNTFHWYGSDDFKKAYLTAWGVGA